MIARVACLLPVLAGLLGAGTVARAADARCSAPDGTAGAPAPLGHVAAVLHPGGTLDVLVVGSATVFGPEAALAAAAPSARVPGTPPPPGNAAPPAAAPPAVASPSAFPLVMGREMEAANPGLTVHVTVRGARGLAGAEMVDVIRAALKERPFQLVLWQTGTVEAVRNVQPGDFAQTLADGQQIVRDAGADLVLVDPQYSRVLQTSANLDPYFQAFGQAATAPDVGWFHRYDLMRGWVGTGDIDLERTGRDSRKDAVVLLHSCLGQQLARFVADSARS